MEWPEIIEFLIEKGHDFKDIKDYNLYQLKTFYETGVKMDNERIKNTFALDAISSSGNTEVIKDVASKMNRDNRIAEVEKIKQNLRDRKKF